MPDTTLIINNIVNAYLRLREAGANLRAAQTAYVRELENESKRSVSRAEMEFQRATNEAQQKKMQRLAQLDQQWQAKQASIKRDLFAATRALDFIAADWNMPEWNSFALHNGAVPNGVRVGAFKLNTPFKLAPIPALAPLIGHKHVLIAYHGAMAETANQLLQATALRLAATFPVDAFRFSFMDADGLGNNLRAFLTLPELVRGDDIVATEREIEDELARISAHIKNVIQTRLSSSFNTIEDYNDKLGDVSVPYQFVVIANFPTHFTDRAADHLTSIAQNGMRAGVYLIASADLDKKPPHNFEWNTLHNLATVALIQSNDECTWNDPDFPKVTITPDRMPPPALTKTILETTGKAAVTKGGVGLKFSKIAPPQPWWNTPSAEFLSAPLGFNDKGLIHEFRLGLANDTVHHALVGGQTGSGKTNMLHVLLINLCLKYHPDELELYLVDFKEGVEFQEYAKMNLPHARAVAIETEREFGLSILHRLQREMESRGKLFGAAGVQNIQNYRANTNKRMPRLLLIVDEFQVLFDEDDALAQQAGNVLADLVKRGRSFGIHILLSSQEPPRNFANGRAVYGQMALRLCFQCQPDHARMILGDENDAAKSLERPGEMFYNEDNGKPDKNVFVRVAYLPPAERAAALDQIQALAQTNNFSRVEPLAVFEGAAPAQLLDNAEFRRQLWSPQYSVAPAPLLAPLGSAIEIKAHTTAALERQARSNLLIIGSEEIYARGMMAGAVLGIAAQRSPRAAVFYVLDYGKPDVDNGNIFQHIKQVIPHTIELIERVKAGEALERLNRVVTKRATTSGNHSPQIFFVIFGAHGWRELKSSDPYMPSELSQTLTHIIQEGPDVGLHTLVWVNSLPDFERAFQRKGLEFFDLRAATLLPQNDAMNFLENAAAAKLGPNRAVFRSQDWQTGRLEKFKPYALPNAAALEQMRQRFARKTTS